MKIDSFFNMAIWPSNMLHYKDKKEKKTNIGKCKGIIVNKVAFPPTSRLYV